MYCNYDVLPVILYTLGCILLITLIILTIKVTITVKKIDKVIDDIDNKSKKLNGVFDIVDTAADSLSLVSDKVVGFIVNGLYSLFKGKNKKEEEKKENE